MVESLRDARIEVSMGIAGPAPTRSLGLNFQALWQSHCMMALKEIQTSKQPDLIGLIRPPPVRAGKDLFVVLGTGSGR
jgi:hypothetical protein